MSQSAETPKIFVADDDENIRTIISSLLDSIGYDIITTDNADDVIPTVLEEKPHVAVLDVKMPGEKNGFELCYQIKNHPKIANCPVMMLTATTQESMEPDEHWRKKSRADDFITKPFQSADFSKRIKKLVKKAWKQKENPRFQP